MEEEPLLPFFIILVLVAHDLLILCLMCCFWKAAVYKLLHLVGPSRRGSSRFTTLNYSFRHELLSSCQISDIWIYLSWYSLKIRSKYFSEDITRIDEVVEYLYKFNRFLGVLLKRFIRMNYHTSDRISRRMQKSKH